MATVESYSHCMAQMMTPPPMPSSETEEVRVPRQSDVSRLLAEYQNTCARMALCSVKMEKYAKTATGDTVQLPDSWSV